MEVKFCDGISTISVVNNMIRIEFFGYTGAEKNAEGQFPRENHLRLVLPAEGFLQTYESLGKLVDEFKQKGFITSREEAENLADNSSPNF